MDRAQQAGRTKQPVWTKAADRAGEAVARDEAVGRGRTVGRGGTVGKGGTGSGAGPVARRRRVVRGAAGAMAVVALAAGCKAVAAAPEDTTGAARYTNPPPITFPTAPPTPAPRTGTRTSAPTDARTEPSYTDAGPTTPPEPTAPATPRERPPRPVATIGTRGELVRELQARLRQLTLFERNPTGFYGSVTARSVAAFQRQSGQAARTGALDSATWSALRARTATPTRTELYPPTSKPLAAPDPRCLTGRVVCVSKESDTLAWMIDGRVVSAMDVRFGSQYTPTREGTFRVYFKSRHHVSTIYHTPMPYALFFSGGQAVHYSADFAARGYSGASHGCVNVRDRQKVSDLFRQVRKGDRVVIYH